jgi:hypothetical protein
MNPMEMMIQNMIMRDPTLQSVWNQTLQMAKGKNEQEGMQMIQNIAKTQGIDLEKAQQQFNQFMGSFKG